MNFKRSKRIIAVFVWFFFSTSLLAYERGLGYLPEDWYSIPEKKDPSNSLLSQNKRNEAQSLDSVSRSVQTILNANELALSKIRERQGKKWYLDNIRTNLAIGGSGLVGLMTMKGTASVRMYWRPKELELKYKKKHMDPPVAEKYDMAFSTDMSEEEISATLEPIIEHALASGRVREKEKFEKNLRQAAIEFHSIVAGSKNYANRSNFFVNGFMVEFYISAGGTVSPFFTVGTEIRIRFVWSRMNRIKPKFAAQKPIVPKTAKLRAARTNLSKFLAHMVQDLELASEGQMEETQYKLANFRVGLGIGVKGSISAAKLSSKIYFFVMFKRKKKALIKQGLQRNSLLAKVAKDGEDSYMTVMGGYDLKEIEFAKKNNIDFEVEEKPNLKGGKSITNVIYKIQRKHFRKGLLKAYEMTNYFAKEISKKPRKKWEIYHVETHFELSLTGKLGLASLSGIAAARMNFLKS